MPPTDIMALGLALVVVGTLAAAVTGVAAPAWLASAAYLGFLAAGLASGFGRRERMLVLAAAALAAAIPFAAADPPALLAEALARAAYLATFLLSLGFLRDAARGSRLVRTAGAFLTAQPPGRRYLALGLGAHGLGILLNFGVLNLLATTVRRGNTLALAGGDPSIRAIRERRMMSSLMRGFATVMLWAPTTISQALVLTLVPGLVWTETAPIGAGLAVALILLGWAFDRIAWPPSARRGLPRPPPVPGGGQALARLGLLTAGLLAAVGAAHAAFDLSLVSTVMLIVPPFAAVWTAGQHRRLGASRALGLARRRLVRTVRCGFPASRAEVVLLSTAGFIGTGLAGLVPAAAVAAWIEQWHLPPLVLLGGLMALIPLAAQIAVTPIVTVTVLGGALSQFTGAGLDPRLLGLALTGGWALTLITSPFSASILVTARITGRPTGEIARGWNGRYAVAGYAALLLLLALVALAVGSRAGVADGGVPAAPRSAATPATDPAAHRTAPAQALAADLVDAVAQPLREPRAPVSAPVAQPAETPTAQEG